MNDNLPADLESRILLLLDGELDDESIAELDEMLQSDKSARELYLQTAALHSALQTHHLSRSNLPLMPLIPMKRLLDQHRRQQIRYSLIAAAALLIIAAVTLSLITSRPPKALASFRVTPEATFTLSHPEDRRDKESPQDGSTLREGSRLRITGGSMEISFASGVRSIIEAPCDLVVLEEDRLSMEQGTGWFEVPPAAIGFTIETPRLTIVDLGTEFGVHAPADGSHEIHVFRGKVQASVSSSGGNEQRTILTAGMARKTDATGDFLDTPLDTRRFRKSLTDSPALRNPGFDLMQEPSSDLDVRGYGPIASWGTSGLGIGISNQSQPFLNQPPHSGTHAAFIQGRGQIAQTLNGFDPSKPYTVTYFVSERGLPGAAVNTSVSLDLGNSSYSPDIPIIKTDAFRRIVSGPLAVYGPTANVQIGSRVVSGDGSLLIDSVSVSRAVPAIPDGGFENPAQGGRSFKQAAGNGEGSLTGTRWTFASGGGITGNGSPFLPPLAPEGSQAAILQNHGASFSTIVSGFEPGVTYTLSFEAAARNGGAAPFHVRLGDDTLPIGNASTLTPSHREYTTFTSDSFTTGQDSLILKFEATGKGTSFVDDLRFNFVDEAR